MFYPSTIKIFLWIFQTCVEIIFLPVIILRFFTKSEKCPPVTDKLLFLSASEVARRIRKKQITSVTIVKVYISRIKEVNPIINAVIENRFYEALQDAQKADDIVQNCGLSEDQIEKNYPLLGVPITIKGSIAVKGMKHTAGRKDLHAIAKTDAVCVKYVRDAGAIPLLISNVPELCLNWETSNRLIGSTVNPYNTLRTPGGSSGGEASLLGSGASLIGIGSDIAGSLRLPAHCCGIWGHKPSSYVVSTVGHYPNSKNKEWNNVFTLGPIARYASDLKLLLNVMAEPHMKNIVKLKERVDMKKIKVYYMEDSKSVLADRVDKVVIKAIEKVRSHFDAICDSKSRKVELPLTKYWAELSYLCLLHIDDVENIFEGKGDGAYYELLKYLTCQSSHEFTSICYGILRRNMYLIPCKFMSGVYSDIKKLRDDFIRILGDDGVFILPTSPLEATYQNDVIRRLFNSGYLSIFNVLGFPATHCPIMFSTNGLPIGIQVVAAPNMDNLTLSVAEEIEKIFGGWKF